VLWAANVAQPSTQNLVLLDDVVLDVGAQLPEHHGAALVIQVKAVLVALAHFPP